MFGVGCDENRYSDCGSLCPPKCKYSHCDAFNGSCIHGCSKTNEVTIDCIGKACVGMFSKN